jgi:hypothetical protein
VNFFGWITDRFFIRGRAMSVYRRGMARARRQDCQGAILQYSTVVDMPGVPGDVKAMALYNRALALSAAGSGPRGIADLNEVIAMESTPVNVRTMARQALARIESRSRQNTT